MLCVCDLFLGLKMHYPDIPCIARLFPLLKQNIVVTFPVFIYFWNLSLSVHNNCSPPMGLTAEIRFLYWRRSLLELPRKIYVKSILKFSIEGHLLS